MSQNLIQEIHRAFQQIPESRVALEEGDRSYSYKEFKTAVFGLSNLLNKNRCSNVAVIGEPSFLTAVSLVSSLISDSLYIPVDPLWPLKRINRILQYSKTDTVLISLDTLKKFSVSPENFAAPSLFLLQSQNPSQETKIQPPLLIDKYQQGQKEQLDFSFFHSPPSSKKTNSSIAYIMYTSGSTGEPKGVQVPLKALQKFLHWVQEEFAITSQDRFSYNSSLGFGASIRQIFSPLLSGAQNICFPPETLKSPSAFLEALKEKQISFLNAPPIVLQQLAVEAGKQKKEKHFLSKVRLVLAGGDLFPKSVLELWQRQFPHPHQVVNLYGSTESIVNASSYKHSIPKPLLFDCKILPIGKPRPGFSFLLRNEKGKLIDRDQEVGELCIKSAFLSKAYHKNKEETAKVFSFLEEETIYNTGDRALRLSSKDYVVLGRKDSQAQIYGQRVELGEIENCLNTHPQIQRALAVHLRDKGLDKIFAFLLMESHQNYDEKALRSFLSKELPSYMIPHGFYQIDQIPITGSNKADYKKLKDIVQQKLLEREINQSDSKGQKVLSLLNDQELTEEIKALWKKYLGEKKLSDQDSFFEVGGDSIMAVNLYQSICELFDFSPDPYVFYTNPTIKNIVKAIRQSQEENLCEKQANLQDKKDRPYKKTSSLLSIKSLFFDLFLKAFKLKNKFISFFWTKSSVCKGLQSPQQKSFLFMKQIFNESYNGFFSVPIENPLNLEEFKKALRCLIQSQESLRTLFIGEDQVVLPEEEAEILFYDLTAQTKEEQQDSIHSTEEKLLKHSFSFSNPPLFRLALLQLSSEKSQLIFCINHIVADGWSLQAFLSGLNASYVFLKKGGPALFKHSYLDYTKKYKAFCRESFQRNQSFWNQKLARISSYNLSSKFDKSDPLSSEESLKLERRFVEKAFALSKNQNTSSAYVYLALWAKSLKEFLGCSKICFWTTYHGRDFPFTNLNSMIGSIARAAPLMMDLQKINSLKDFLRITQESYRQTLKHKDFNIVKPFLSNQTGSNVLHNWIGFNYLNFQPLERLTKSFPFTMDFSQAKLQLSSSEKSYKRLFLFFSVHNYKGHVDFKVVGKALKEDKKTILQLMKKHLEESIL